MALDPTTNTLLSNILDAVSAQTRSLEEQYGEIQSRRDTRSATPFGGKTRGEINQETKAAKNQAAAYAENAKKIAAASEQFSTLGLKAKQIENMAVEFRDSGVTMTKALEEQIATVIERSRAGDNSEEMMEKLNKELAHASKGMDIVAVKAIKQSQIIHKNTRRWMASTDALKEFVDRTTSLKGSVALVTAGLTKYASTLQESIKRQAPMLDGISEGLELAARYGLSVSELMRATDDHTAMLLANAKSGQTLRASTKEYMGAFSDLRDQAWQLTGSYDDANKLVMASFDAMSRVGIGTTFANMKGPATEMMRSMHLIAKTTNRTSEEVARSTVALMKDTDIRKDMLQLNVKDRANYVNRLLQDQQMFVLRGMEIEQAEEAVKALRNIAGQDPRERLKEASKMAAVAASLGVEGGQQMVQLSMKARAQWTKDEVKMAADFATDLEKAQTAAMGGGFGQQATTFALMGKVAGGQFYEQISKLSTLGLEDLAIDEATAAQVEQASILGTLQKPIAEGMQIMQLGAAFFKDPGALIFAGFAGFAAKNLLLLGKIAFFNKGFGKAFAKTQTTGMGMGSGKIGAFRGVAGLTAAAAIIPYAIDNIVDLVKSGGETSSAYEFMRETFPKFTDGLGEALFNVFGDTKEDIQARKDEDQRRADDNQKLIDAQLEALGLQKEYVSLAKKQLQVAEDVGKANVHATNDQTSKQDSNARTRHINGSLQGNAAQETGN